MKVRKCLVVYMVIDYSKLIFTKYILVWVFWLRTCKSLSFGCYTGKCKLRDARKVIVKRHRLLFIN